MGIGKKLGKLAVKGLKKAGIKAKQGSGKKSRKTGILGDGMAQEAAEHIKGRRKKIEDAVDGTSGKERKGMRETKGRR